MRGARGIGSKPGQNLRDPIGRNLGNMPKGKTGVGRVKGLQSHREAGTLDRSADARPFAYLSGTHPCATDVSLGAPIQVRKSRARGEKKVGLLGAAAARELMSTHCRWQRPTHESSRTQGRLKAAEDNGSEGGRWREMAAGSGNKSFTLYKTVQVSTGYYHLAGRLLVKTTLSQVYMFNPLAGRALTDRGLQTGSHPNRLPAAWPYQPAAAIKQANLRPGQDAISTGHSRSPKPACITASLSGSSWPIPSVPQTAHLGRVAQRWAHCPPRNVGAPASFPSPSTFWPEVWLPGSHAAEG